MRQAHFISVIDLIEDFFGTSLDPDFIQSVDRISEAQIIGLFHSYNDFAASYVPRPADPDELQPVNDRFPTAYYIPQLHRAPSGLFFNSAMSQLLYAHRVLFLDSLGHNLATWAHGKYEGSRPLWYRDSSKAGFARYLENLSFLRPMIESNLVTVLPRAITPADVFIDPFEGFHFFTGDGRSKTSEFDAWEFFGGVDARRQLEGLWHEMPSNQDADAMRTWNERVNALHPPAEHERLEVMRIAFDSLERKLAPDRLAIGDLALETVEQRRAFEWAVAKLRATSEREAILFFDLETIALPNLANLDAKDIIDLHQHKVFEDFRTAISRAMDRVPDSGANSLSARRRAVREELGAVRRAAIAVSRETRLREERAKTMRDIAIGVAVGAGLAPAVGWSGAAAGAAGVSGRSVLSLLWSWMATRRRAEADNGLRNCFSALTD